MPLASASPADFADSPIAAIVPAPRLSRRSALLGVAALLAPLAAGISRAAPPAAPAATKPDGLIRLSSNENPYGPSPEARREILASADEAPRYAFDSIRRLVDALAEREHFDRSQLVIGSGSGEILNMAGLLAAEGGAGGELIAAEPTFEDLPEFAAKFGVVTRSVPLDAGHRHDLAAMHAAITPNTRLVYVCNPHNPTGTALRRDVIAGFLRSVPEATLVLVDEAYIDLADADGVGTVVELVKERPNLLVTRTFSKIHGLAGLRVGYAIATPALAARLRAKQLAWPNITGLRAARASLGAHGFLAETRRALIADRNRIEAAVDRSGLAHAQSQGNFVFFDTGRPVREFAKAMLDKGIQVGRPFVRYDTWARVTVGTRAEVDRLLAVLPSELKRRA